MEISPSFVKGAKNTVSSMGIKNVEIKKIKVNDIPCVDNTFDVLLMVDVIHHCSDLKAILKEAFRTF